MTNVSYKFWALGFLLGTCAIAVAQQKRVILHSTTLEESILSELFSTSAPRPASEKAGLDFFSSGEYGCIVPASLYSRNSHSQAFEAFKMLPEDAFTGSILEEDLKPELRQFLSSWFEVAPGAKETIASFKSGYRISANPSVSLHFTVGSKKVTYSVEPLKKQSDESGKCEIYASNEDDLEASMFTQLPSPKGSKFEVRTSWECTDTERFRVTWLLFNEINKKQQEDRARLDEAIRIRLQELFDSERLSGLKVGSNTAYQSLNSTLRKELEDEFSNNYSARGFGSAEEALRFLNDAQVSVPNFGSTIMFYVGQADVSGGIRYSIGWDMRMISDIGT